VSNSITNGVLKNGGGGEEGVENKKYHSVVSRQGLKNKVDTFLAIIVVVNTRFKILN